MCDKELLIAYLYGELQPSERDAFDRHLAACADCRGDADGLRGTRTYLQSWAPPEPDLGFQIVRAPHRVAPASTARWWRVSPAWGLAAAAMFVGAISAGIANLEITAGTRGVSVRTGRGRPAAVQVQAADPSDAIVAELKARLTDVEAQLSAARQTTSAATPVATVTTRMSDAELVRLFRQMIEQSEERQQGVLARQILQVNRDMDTARRTDYDRLRQGIQQVQGTAFEVYQRQKAFEDHVVRVGMQR